MNTNQTVSRDYLLQSAQNLKSRPRWPEAFSWFCTNYGSVHDASPWFTKLVSGRARYQIVFKLLALCHENEALQIDGGNIYKQIRAFAQDYGLASPNCATDIVKRLISAGFLHSERSARDRRSANITITDAGRNLARRTVLHFGTAVSIAEELDFLSHVRVDGFAMTCTAYYLDIFMQAFDPEATDGHLSAFLQHDAGLGTVLDIMGRHGNRASSGNKIVTFSFSAVASRYGVSVGHLRRLIREAETAGLLRLHNGSENLIEIMPLLARSMSDYIATVMAISKEAALQTLREMGETPATLRGFSMP